MIVPNKKSTPKLVNMENSLHLTSKTFAPSVDYHLVIAPNADVSPELTAKGAIQVFLIKV